VLAISGHHKSVTPVESAWRRSQHGVVVQAGTTGMIPVGEDGRGREDNSRIPVSGDGEVVRAREEGGLVQRRSGQGAGEGGPSYVVHLVGTT
jgi:hypothetical protein